MATDTRGSPLTRLRPRRETLLWGSVLVTLELGALAVHSVFGSSSALSPAGLRLWVYPFVWINVGLWAIVRTAPAATGASPRQRTLVGVLAVAYFAVLAYAGGLVGHGTPAGAGAVNVVWGTVPPGWAPVVTYAGSALTLTLVPFKLAGYLALAYLVYATVLDAARSAVTGLLGVLSCVSCSWPVLASLATGVAGGSSGLAAAVTTGSYGLSTLVFVATVALLYWRPFGPRE
ncbi:MAG: hypothetical protein V5A44_04815 [Haloarculaceae archaeon]